MLSCKIRLILVSKQRITWEFLHKHKSKYAVDLIEGNIPAPCSFSPSPHLQIHIRFTGTMGVAYNRISDNLCSLLILISTALALKYCEVVSTGRNNPVLRYDIGSVGFATADSTRTCGPPRDHATVVLPLNRLCRLSDLFVF